MKISFSTIGCPEWPWKEIVSMAADLGFEGIEIRGVLDEIYAPNIKYFRPDRIEKTQRQLKETNLQLVCMTTGSDLSDAAKREENVHDVREYIDLSAQVGVQNIRVLGDNVIEPGHPVDTGLVEGLLFEVGEYAHQKGVMLLLETNGFYADSNNLKKTLDAVNLPSVKALWDIHHPYRFFGETPEETVSILGDDIRHVHVKDSRMADDHVRYCLLGQGDIPVKECVLALSNNNYDGFYSLEWVKRWDKTLEEPGLVFAHYASYMRGL